MSYQFTDEDRAKSKAKRAENKAAKEAQRAAALEAQDIDKARLGAKCLAVLENIIDTSKDDALRVSAARTMLPYLLPQLRSIESETVGENPININVQLVDQNRERHGDVDPAEFAKGTFENEGNESEGEGDTDTASK